MRDKTLREITGNTLGIPVGERRQLFQTSPFTQGPERLITQLVRPQIHTDFFTFIRESLFSSSRKHQSRCSMAANPEPGRQTANQDQDAGRCVSSGHLDPVVHTCSAGIPSIPTARPWFPHPQSGDHQAEPQCPVPPPDTNRAGTQGCLFQYQPWACTGPAQTLILVALPDRSGSVFRAGCWCLTEPRVAAEGMQRLV